jgi:hypothetical protein
LAACHKGLSVGFITASALVHELLEARDERQLLHLQRQLAGYELLIIGRPTIRPRQVRRASAVRPDASDQIWAFVKALSYMPILK